MGALGCPDYNGLRKHYIMDLIDIEANPVILFLFSRLGGQAMFDIKTTVLWVSVV